ncbi:MAG: hypothetical protein GF331_20310 [Chitinivibrionales bacterium]|nr:hypothetical protein [Chitinivibrionales bacterium]
MAKTNLTIDGEQFLINGKPVYSEIEGSNPDAHGLLMNARFIQGIFDDKADPARFARMGHDTWDPEANTDRLIAALPQWHAHGLRAFTVGFQGGGPCFTTDNTTIHNNPFGEDGTALDPAYAGRMDRLIRGADETGMAVIVSFFYGAQTTRLRDGRAIRSAVTTASRFLRDGGYTNVIIEIANEHDVGPFRQHPLVFTEEGVAALIDLAREESGGMPVGCSGVGGSASRQIIEASDVLLIHGNGQSRQRYANLIKRVRDWAPGRPVVCNEDSQAVGQLLVAFNTKSSWGYYNNMTKQEPPADWSITKGEDTFFALRMAKGIGIQVEEPPLDEQFYLQGFEPRMAHEGNRWIRLASLYPERIDYVEFLRNGELYDTCYDEPFAVAWRGNWVFGGTKVQPGEQWKAVVHLTNGEVVEREATVPEES